MPAPPAETAPGIIATIEKDASWVKAHIIALLISLTLIIGTAAGAVYGVESLIAKHDLAEEQKADAKLNLVISSANSSLQQSNAVNQQLVQMITQLQAQNAQLEKGMAQRNAQNAKQQQVDATLSATDAAARLASQTHAASGEVKATGDTIDISLPVARSIVSDEDTLVTISANLKDTTAELANEKALFSKSQDANAAQAKAITDLQAENKEQVVACAAEVKTLKAQARKSKMKWFVGGYVAGLLTRGIIKLTTGV